MTGEFFTFDNSRDRSRISYDQFLLGLDKESGTSRNEYLWKIFSLFDKNQSGKIDTEPEALELFGFMKGLTGDDEVLQKKEIESWLNRNGYEFGFGTDDNNIFAAASAFLKDASETLVLKRDDKGRVVKRECNSVVKEYIYHDGENGENSYVEVIINNGESRYYVSEIDEEGKLSKNSKLLLKEKRGLRKEIIRHEADGKNPAYVEVIINGRDRYYYSEVDNNGDPTEGSRLLREEVNGVLTTYTHHFEKTNGKKESYVEKKAGDTLYKVKEVDINGLFTDEDFISSEYTDNNGHKVTINRYAIDGMSLIAETEEITVGESIKRIYGTESYHVFKFLKQYDMLPLDVIEIYTKGDNEYFVSYDNKNGMTVTHAAYKDTVDILLDKFCFESKEEFYELNPKLRDKEIKACDRITVPGRYSADELEILNQGTLQGEWDLYYRDYLKALRDEYFINISDELLFAMQEVEGFELTKNTTQMYSKIDALEKDKRTIVLECIKNRTKTEGSAEIKNRLLRDYRINLYDDVSFNIGSRTLSPSEIKSAGARTLTNNSNNAYMIYKSNTSEAGLLTKLVGEIKDFNADLTEDLASVLNIENSNLSRTNVGRKLLREHTSAYLLECASGNKGVPLTKKIYYDIKMDLALSLLPRAISTEDKEKAKFEEDLYLRTVLGEFTPEELDKFIYCLSEMSDDEYEEKVPTLVENMRNYGMRLLSDSSRIVDMPKLGITDKAAIVPGEGGKLRISEQVKKVQLWPPMSYEEVFNLEMGVPYDEARMKDYLDKEEHFIFLTGLYNTKAFLVGQLEEATNTLLGLGHGMYYNPTESENMSDDIAKATTQVISVLREIYGEDEKISEVLETLGYSDLRIEEDGGLINRIRFNQDMDKMELSSLIGSINSLIESNYDKETDGHDLDYYKNEMNAAYRAAFGDHNAENYAEMFAADLQNSVGRVEDAVAISGCILLIAANCVPVFGEVADILAASGYTLLLGGNVSLMAMDASTKKGGMTEEDKQAIFMTTLGNIETVAMLYATGGISNGFKAIGDAIVKKVFPNMALKAALQSSIEGTTSLGIKTFNIARSVGNSALTFGTWDGFMGGLHYEIGLSDEETLGNAVSHGFTQGAKFGTYMALTGMGIRYITGNITKGLFKNELPKIEEASESALKRTESAFSEATSFSGSQVSNVYDKAFANAMTHEGAKTFQNLLNFGLETTAFTAYDVVGALKTEEKPEGLSWGEYIWETTKGQAANLLKIKSLGYIMSSHNLNERTSEVFPKKLKPEEDIIFRSVVEDGVTRWEGRYPDGRKVVTNNMNEVLALSNMHRQQVLIYDPLDKLLDENNGSLDIGDGMEIVKDENGYGVIFEDKTIVTARNLRSAISQANSLYTLNVNEKMLQKKGSLELGNHTFTYNKNTKTYQTITDGKEIVQSDSFKDLLNVLISKEMTASLKDAFHIDKSRSDLTVNEGEKDEIEHKGIDLGNGAYMVYDFDGKFRVVTLNKKGEAIEIASGNTIEEVVNKMFVNPQDVYVNYQNRTATPEGAKGLSEEITSDVTEEETLSDDYDAVFPEITVIKRTKPVSEQNPQISVGDINLENLKFANEKLKLKAENALSKISTPEQKQVANKIFSDARLYNNSSIMSWLSNIIEYTKSPEEAQAKIDVMNIILTNEGFYNGDSMGAIIAKVSSPEIAKTQIDVMEKFLSDDKFYNNENLVKNIGNILYSIFLPEDAQAKIDIMNKFLSDERLYGNQYVINSLTDIIQLTDSEESAQAKIDVIDKILSDARLYDNDDLIEQLGKIITSTDSTEFAKLRIYMMDIILSDEKLYNNSNLIVYLGNIIDCSDSPICAQIKIDIMNRFLSDARLYGNDSIAEDIGNIIYAADTPVRARAINNLIDRILSDERLYNNDSVQRAFGQILLQAVNYKYSQAMLSVIDKIFSDERLYNSESFMKIAGNIIASADSPKSAKNIVNTIDKILLKGNDNVIKLSRYIVLKSCECKEEIIDKILDAVSNLDSKDIDAIEHFCKRMNNLEELYNLLFNEELLNRYIRIYNNAIESGVEKDNLIIIPDSLSDEYIKNAHGTYIDNNDFVKTVTRDILYNNENNSKTEKEIVITPNGQKEHTVLTNYASGIVELVEDVIKDIDGNILYKERYVLAKNLPKKYAGRYNIYRDYPDGRTEQVGIATKTPEGTVVIKRILAYDNGYSTDYEYTENPDASRTVRITMTDDNGNTTLHHEFEYKVIDENHFQTIENGITYDIQYTKNEVIATNEDTGEQVRVSIGDNAEGTESVLSRDLIPMLKHSPGSFYFGIDRYNLQKIGLGIDNTTSRSHYSPAKNLIGISDNRYNSNFTEAHEYNHFIIQNSIGNPIESVYSPEYQEYRRKILDATQNGTSNSYKNVSLKDIIRTTFRILYIPEECPDAEEEWKFLQENFPETFDAIARSINTDLLETYVEERRQLMQNQPPSEVEALSYFIESKSYRDTDILCSLEELISDIRGFLYAPTQMKSEEYIQKYFPKTFALAANMILHNTPYRTVDFRTEIPKDITIEPEGVITGRLNDVKQYPETGDLFDTETLTSDDNTKIDANLLAEIDNMIAQNQFVSDLYKKLHDSMVDEFYEIITKDSNGDLTLIAARINAIDEEFINYWYLPNATFILDNYQTIKDNIFSIRNFTYYFKSFIYEIINEDILNEIIENKDKFETDKEHKYELLCYLIYNKLEGNIQYLPSTTEVDTNVILSSLLGRGYMGGIDYYRAENGKIFEKADNTNYDGHSTAVILQQYPDFINALSGIDNFCSENEEIFDVINLLIDSECLPAQTIFKQVESGSSYCSYSVCITAHQYMHDNNLPPYADIPQSATIQDVRTVTKTAGKYTATTYLNEKGDPVKGIVEDSDENTVLEIVFDNNGKILNSHTYYNPQIFTERKDKIIQNLNDLTNNEHVKELVIAELNRIESNLSDKDEVVDTIEILENFEDILAKVFLITDDEITEYIESELNNLKYIPDDIKKLELFVDAFNTISGNYVHYADSYGYYGPELGYALKLRDYIFKTFEKALTKDLDVSEKECVKGDLKAMLKQLEHDFLTITSKKANGTKIAKTIQYMKVYIKNLRDEIAIQEAPLSPEDELKCNALDKVFHKIKSTNDELHNTIYELIDNDLFPDFKEDLTTAQTKNYCKNNPASPGADILYQRYLENVTADEKVLSMITEINDKYGTKVFLSKGDYTVEAIEAIRDTFAEIERASNGQAVRIPIIDLSAAKLDYYDDSSTAAYCETDTGSIAINPLTHKIYTKMIKTFIHEDIHANNQTKQGLVTPSFDEIKDRQLYKDEFRKAGISEGHIDYAYTNASEFVSVAAEGDMSKYSDEFKEVLASFGMPRWALDIKLPKRIEIRYQKTKNIEGSDDMHYTIYRDEKYNIVKLSSDIQCAFPIEYTPEVSEFDLLAALGYETFGYSLYSDLGMERKAYNAFNGISTSEYQKGNKTILTVKAYVSEDLIEFMDELAEIKNIEEIDKIYSEVAERCAQNGTELVLTGYSKGGDYVRQIADMHRDDYNTWFVTFNENGIHCAEDERIDAYSTEEGKVNDPNVNVFETTYPDKHDIRAFLYSSVKPTKPQTNNSTPKIEAIQTEPGIKESSIEIPEGYEIDKDGTIIRKSAPAGMASMSNDDAKTQGISPKTDETGSNAAEELKQMFLNAGFTEKELAEIDFNNSKFDFTKFISEDFNKVIQNFEGKHSVDELLKYLFKPYFRGREEIEDITIRIEILDKVQIAETELGHPIDITDNWTFNPTDYKNASIETIILAVKVAKALGDDKLYSEDFKHFAKIEEYTEQDIIDIAELGNRVKLIAFHDTISLQQLIGIKNLFNNEYKELLDRICSAVEESQAGLLTENSFKYLLYENSNDIELFTKILKNRKLNNSASSQQAIPRIIDIIKKYPEFEQDLIDISDFSSTGSDFEKIVQLWKENRNEKDTIKQLALAKRDIAQIETVLMLLSSSMRTDVLEIALSNNIEFDDVTDIQAIIDIKQNNKSIASYIQTYLSNKRTETSAGDAKAFVEFLNNHSENREYILRMVQNPNMTLENMEKVIQLKDQFQNDIKKQELIDYLATDGKFDIDTIIQTLNDIQTYPEFLDIITTNITVTDFIDTSSDNGVLSERNNAKLIAENRADSNSIALLKEMLGDYYDNLKWELMINSSMTSSQINDIVNDLIEKSAAFTRISFVERNYGKNSNWATSVQKTMNKAVIRLQKGASFNDVLNQIATDYQNEARSHKERFNNTGVRRGLSEPGLAYSYTKYNNTLYSEYKDIFDATYQQYQHNKPSPYEDVKITQISADRQMIHPYDNGGKNSDNAIKHCEDCYAKIQPLIEKVTQGKKLTDDELKLAKDNIAEIHFLITNAMPYVRGSAGIADCLTRSFYKALGLNIPIVKDGIGLDLEGFARNLTDYQAYWDDFFVNRAVVIPAHDNALNP